MKTIQSLRVVRMKHLERYLVQSKCCKSLPFCGWISPSTHTFSPVSVFLQMVSYRMSILPATVLPSLDSLGIYSRADKGSLRSCSGDPRLQMEGPGWMAGGVSSTQFLLFFLPVLYLFIAHSSPSQLGVAFNS